MLKSVATANDVWHDRDVLDSVALVVTDDSPEELSVHLEDTFTTDDLGELCRYNELAFFCTFARHAQCLVG